MGGSAKFLGRTKYGKCPIFQGFEAGIFQSVPDTLDKITLHLSDQFATLKSQKALYFLDKPQTVFSFLTLSLIFALYFGG